MSESIKSGENKERSGGGVIRNQFNARWGTDPLGYYHENYAGVTLEWLRFVDILLYLALWRKNLLHNLPRSNKKRREQRSWKDYTGDELVTYYETHYRDVTRYALSRKNYALYAVLKRRKLLNFVPKKITWKDYTD